MCESKSVVNIDIKCDANSRKKRTSDDHLFAGKQKLYFYIVIITDK